MEVIFVNFFLTKLFLRIKYSNYRTQQIPKNFQNTLSIHLTKQVHVKPRFFLGP